MSLIAGMLAGILFFSLLSERLQRSAITLPIFFTALGYGMTQIPDTSIAALSDHGMLLTLTEATLVLVLFSDASHVRLRDLWRSAAYPARMLLIAMPLAILLGAGVARFMTPEAPWVITLLLAAILAPTDAALAQAVTSSEKVPARLRRSIEVESGLNDGLALPMVLAAAVVAVEVLGVTGAQVPANLGLFTLKQIILGPLAGIAVGWVAARALDLAMTTKSISPAYDGLVFLAAAFLAFAVAGAIGGNGLIAAFVGGLTFGHALRTSTSFISEFMSAEGKLLTMLSFTIFGAAMVPDGLAHASWATVGAAVCFLTIVRMGPVWLSLAGTGLRPREKLFLGWFGPRGLASVLFSLLVLEKFQLPHIEELVACVVLTVILSVVLHGLSARPLASLVKDQENNDA